MSGKGVLTCGNEEVAVYNRTERERPPRAANSGGLADWIGVDVTTVPTPEPARKPGLLRTKPIPADLAAKLYKRATRGVKRNRKTGCLIRHIAVNPKTGYTQCAITVNKRTTYFYAHRVVWTHLKGPIPSGYTLDHLCKQPACINVDHLEPVTQRENVLRSSNPCAQNARREECKHGHPLVPRTDGRRGRYCPTCKAGRYLAKGATA